MCLNEKMIKNLSKMGNKQPNENLNNTGKQEKVRSLIDNGKDYKTPAPANTYHGWVVISNDNEATTDDGTTPIWVASQKKKHTFELERRFFKVTQYYITIIKKKKFFFLSLLY